MKTVDCCCLPAQPSEELLDLCPNVGECRTATVVAQEYCELYSLSRADLDEILEDLPELGKVFLKMVESYVEAGFGKNLVNHRLQNRMDTPQPRRPKTIPER